MSTVISSFEGTDKGSDKELAEWSKYAATELTYHVSQALWTPYAKDDLACRVLTHSNYDIGAQVVAGSEQAEAEALSTHLLRKKEYWLAAKLNHNLTFRIGLSTPEKQKYMLTALDALNSVAKESQPGSLG